MRVLAIAGVPGVGKSTFMLKLIQELGGIKARHRSGLCDYATLSGAVVLGKYGAGEVFGGTDKLSMSVEADAEDLISKLSQKPEDITVLLEGDRLCTPVFLRYCQTRGDLRLIILKVADNLLQARREGRSLTVGKEQNETWLKGRESKVYRLETNFFGESRRIDTPEQTQVLANELVDWVRSGTSAVATGRLF